MSSVGHDLLNVPFGDMVMQLASAIAEGQHKLDLVSIEIAKIMGDVSKAYIQLPKIAGNDFAGTENLSLIAAGFIPTFYQFVDTILEVKMAITMSRTTKTQIGVKAKIGWACFSASVNAKYSSKYSYSAEGSSLIRTKIVPVPVPQVLEERLREIVRIQGEGAQLPPPDGDEWSTDIE
ncbi:MAG: hypothetical protein ACFFCE_07335 [Promethearchaeota archaeon]